MHCEVVYTVSLSAGAMLIVEQEPLLVTSSEGLYFLVKDNAVCPNLLVQIHPYFS